MGKGGLDCNWHTLLVHFKGNFCTDFGYHIIKPALQWTCKKWKNQKKSTVSLAFSLENKRASFAEIRAHFPKDERPGLKGIMKNPFVGVGGSLNANSVSRGSEERDMICWLPVCLSQHAPDTFRPQRKASHRLVCLSPAHKHRALPTTID